MSYDITLCDPVTKKTIEFADKHKITGGTYPLGGTNQAWLNVTYTYSKHFRKVFPDNGIRTIYGMSGAESIPLIEAAISQLKDDVSDDYWEATEGNAKQVLIGLLTFAKLRPDGIWSGD